jgi:hypothetical protein
MTQSINLIRSDFSELLTFVRNPPRAEAQECAVHIGWTHWQRGVTNNNDSVNIQPDPVFGPDVLFNVLYWRPVATERDGFRDVALKLCYH